MNENGRPELGQPIRATGQVVNVHKVDEEALRRRTYKEILEHEVKPVDLEGVYVGWRTLQNGRRVYIDDEVGYAFQPAIGETREVWLIVTNPRHNPIRVDPASVTIIEGRQEG